MPRHRSATLPFGLYVACCWCATFPLWLHVISCGCSVLNVQRQAAGGAGPHDTCSVKERPIMDWIRAIVAVAMLVGSGTGALRPAAGTQPATPRFERTACHFKLGAGIVAGRDVRCGFVVVPEDRSVPHGRIIRLAVAIF